MGTVTVIIEKSGSGFSAYLPQLPGCISTSDSLDQLKSEITDAIRFHLEGLKDDGITLPAAFTGGYCLEYSFDVETFLAFYQGVFTRRALSRITGIHESLLSQYAHGLKHPRKLQTKKIEAGLHRLAEELLQIRL
ncbi:MAG: type II toxin-antitoxin system HicB family antitoxin [Bacteroidales bacterium]